MLNLRLIVCTMTTTARRVSRPLTLRVVGHGNVEKRENGVANFSLFTRVENDLISLSARDLPRHFAHLSPFFPLFLHQSLLALL